MREKTSITLSSDLLAQVDQNIGSRGSRSAFIEGVLREYFEGKIRAAINRRDLDLINANIDSLSREAMDVLRYQVQIDYTTED
ncbi:MAG TPA: hypothetical protein VGL00_21050 [Terracidiphilus sp.]